MKKGREQSRPSSEMILTLFAILTKGREEFEQVRGADLAIAVDVRWAIAACDELACAVFTVAVAS